MLIKHKCQLVLLNTTPAFPVTPPPTGAPSRPEMFVDHGACWLCGAVIAGPYNEIIIYSV